MHITHNSHRGIDINDIVLIFKNFFYFGADNFDSEFW